jgi:hypothetical protein
MDSDQPANFEHDLPENTTCSFIIKIWIEELANEQHPARWRGHVTQVPSQQRRYIQNPYDIVRFIAPYLIALGASTQGYPRIRRRTQRRYRKK